MWIGKPGAVISIHRALSALAAIIICAGACFPEVPTKPQPEAYIGKLRLCFDDSGALSTRVPGSF